MGPLSAGVTMHPNPLAAPQLPPGWAPPAGAALLPAPGLGGISAGGMGSTGGGLLASVAPWHMSLDTTRSVEEAVARVSPGGGG